MFFLHTFQFYVQALNMTKGSVEKESKHTALSNITNLLNLVKIKLFIWSCAIYEFTGFSQI